MPAPFSRAFLIVALFMAASSCGKSSSHTLTGSWKLVTMPLIPGPLRVGPEILTLRNDHTYMLQLHDSVESSGAYHVKKQGIPPITILYFGPDESSGSFISFSRDTLVLTYAGIIQALYSPPVSKYVRL